VQFERYVDDAVVHCVSERQARSVRQAIGGQDGTGRAAAASRQAKIVYCRDNDRRGRYATTSFTFLGFTFRPREARDSNSRTFTAFLPAISKEALTRIRSEVRRWRLHLRIGQSIADVARAINPLVRGRLQYYGAFYRSAMHTLLQRINAYLLRWIRKKYRRLRGYRKAKAAWQRITSQHPRLFARWAWVPSLGRSE
jgi:hypothetical protein